MNNADEIVRAAQEAIEHLQGCYEVMSALAEVRKEEIKSLQADLARVTAERDAAVECIESLDDYARHFADAEMENIIEAWRGVQAGEGETE